MADQMPLLQNLPSRTLLQGSWFHRGASDQGEPRVIERGKYQLHRRYMPDDPFIIGREIDASPLHKRGDANQNSIVRVIRSFETVLYFRPETLYGLVGKKREQDGL